MESQFNGSDINYKWKTSHVADTNVLLPDKLNTFFASFEDNTAPHTQPTTKDCGLSFSLANMSKTFKPVSPRKAAGPDGLQSCRPRRPSEHEQVSWLECLQTYINSVPIPVCCPHLLQDCLHCTLFTLYIVPVPKKA